MGFAAEESRLNNGKIIEIKHWGEKIWSYL
jgi:hypothetical protein